MAGAVYAASELRRELITLAFVGNELARSQDFFSALRPLFLPVAQDLSGQIFEPAGLGRELARRYGISIPEDVCEFLVGRITSWGLLDRRGGTSQSALFYWKPTADVPPYDEVAVNKALDELVTELVSFRQSFASLVFNEFEGGELLAIFLEYLKGVDGAVAGAMDALGANDSRVTDVGGKKVFKDEKSYFASRFLDHLAKSNPGLMQWVSRLSTAVLVSEVVLSLKEPPVRSLNLANANYYLDAPFLLEFLGTSGNERKTSAKYTVEKLTANGASVRVLDHSIEEAVEALRALRDKNPGQRHGPTHAAMVRGEVTYLFLQTIIAQFEHFVEQAGVKRVDTSIARFAANQTAVFPDAIMRELEGRLLAGYTTSARAAERDAMSIAFIMRARGRRKATKIQDAKELLLTRNDSLQAIVTGFLKQRDMIAVGEIGPTLLADHITAFIWLAAGDVEKSEIDVRNLLIQSDRVVQASPAAIDSLRDKLAEVSQANAETFEALMQMPRCYQLALDLVGGSVERVMSTNVVEVLERVKRETALELSEQHGDEVRRLKESHQRQATKLRDRSEQARREAERLEQELNGTAQRDEQRSDRIFHAVAEMRARAIYYGKIAATIAAIVWFLFGLGSVVESFRPLPLVTLFAAGGLILSIWHGSNLWNRVFEGAWRGYLRSRLEDAGVAHLAHDKPWPSL